MFNGVLTESNLISYSTSSTLQLVQAAASSITFTFLWHVLHDKYHGSSLLSMSIIVALNLYIQSCKTPIYHICEMYNIQMNFIYRGVEYRLVCTCESANNPSRIWTNETSIALLITLLGVTVISFLSAFMISHLYLQ